LAYNYAGCIFLLAKQYQLGGVQTQATYVFSWVFVKPVVKKIVQI